MKLFEDFDFTLLEDNNFKEDSVREEIILPIFAKLGFKASGSKKIVRSKKLTHPFITVGSTEKPITIYPDYILELNDKPLLVLDAKSPSENIRTGKNVSQVYSYSIHPEVSCDKFALCNGYELIFFRINNKTPDVVIEIPKISDSWNDIVTFLSEKIKPKEEKKPSIENDKFYLTRKLPDIIKKPKKQATKRHFGVHGYFTKQSWDIVDRYIRNFTKEADTVLDPFGGSGVTLIESLMNNRNAIHIDLNPLCIFWMEALLNNTKPYDLKQSADKVIKAYEKQIGQIKPRELKPFLPEDVPLSSKGSDVPNLYGIFSKTQLKELALLKKLILEIKPKRLRNSLLLAFSSAVTQNNLTYHTSNPNQSNLYAGNSGAFIYYRYRLAKEPTQVDLIHSFRSKIKNLVAAKKEIMPMQLNFDIKMQAYKGDACDLNKIENESIDYIYTDPPYGSKIEYLDLSVMWNEWLDLKVTKEDRKKEAIEGGSLNKTKDDYAKLIIRSIREMFRVLKWNRWMSFVFQHQDPFYWYLIVENAEKTGFEYAGVVKQNNGQTSYKKRQNPFSVLSGQLIINFKKIRNPRSIMKADLGSEVSDFILNNIESVIAEHGGATLEKIYDSLIINGLELGFLDKLSEYQDLTSYLRNNFDYDPSTAQYTLRENTPFKSQIPIEKKIKYFLLSYLRRNNRNKIYPNFDDIVLDIMPRLKNGKTPEKQTIRNVLEEIAEHHIYHNGWKLKEIDDKTLF